MMKPTKWNLVCLLLCLLPGGWLSAQELEFMKSDWENNPVLSTPTSEEAKEAAYVVFDKVIIEFGYDEKGELKRYYGRHKRVHLNENKSLESFNRLYLGIRDDKELKVIKARSISAKGKVQAIGKEKVKDLDEKGQTYKILAVEGLETGGEVEYYYCYETPMRIFSTEYPQGTYSARSYEIQIISPENLIYDAKSYNNFPAIHDTLIGDKNYRMAKASSIKAFDEEEKYTAGDANMMRIEYKLARNTAGKSKSRLYTWNDAGKRYFEYFREGAEEAKKDIEKLASKLKLKGMSEEEAIRAIENYIKASIAQLDNNGSSDIKEVIRNKAGSEDGLLKLYVALLDAREIPHELVITCNRYDKKFDPDFDSWNYLESYLLYFPNGKKYLAPHNAYYRYGHFPYHFSGNDALCVKTVSIGDVKTGANTVRKLPISPVEENSDELDLSVKFDASLEDLLISYKHMQAAYPAIGIRAPYYLEEEADKKKEMIYNYLKSYLSENINIKSYTVNNADLSNEQVNKPFTVAAEVNTNAMLEKAGDKILFKVGELIGPQSEMYNEKSRQYDIELTYTHGYVRTLKISIPEGYKVEGLDALKMNITYTDDKGPTFGFTSEYQLNGNELLITVKEYYNRIWYPKSMYDDYVKVINAAADFNKITLVLKK